MLIVAASAAGWYGRDCYEANRYVDGPCCVSGSRSNPAQGGIVVVIPGDVVRTAIDDPYDTSYVQATIWIEGEPIGSWLYNDVTNLIEAVTGRAQIQPSGG